MGVGQPAGEAGFNIARVVAILAGLGDVPGVTVNRYCSSSLQTIRMAAHAIKAGEGDVFIAAGVETVSRYGAGASDTAPNDVFKPAGERTAERSVGGAGDVDAAEGLPDIYIAMGQTAENVVRVRPASPARRWTSSPSSPRTAPSPTSRTASSPRRSRRSRSPTARSCRRTTARVPAPRWRAWPTSSRCSAPTARSPPATPAR